MGEKSIIHNNSPVMKVDQAKNETFIAQLQKKSIEIPGPAKYQVEKKARIKGPSPIKAPKILMTEEI
jgi:hypothetical protein